MMTLRSHVVRAAASALAVLLSAAAVANAAPDPTEGSGIGSDRPVLDYLAGNTARLEPILEDLEDRYHAGRSPTLHPAVDLDSEFMDRSRRNPWMAGLASLVLPGAGQIYNGIAPHAFTLQGFDWWMYLQGGVHAVAFGISLVSQLEGLRVEFAGGGGARPLTERDAQTGRLLHAINAVVASVTAFLEAQLINLMGERYVRTMRMHAFYDPGGTAGVEVCLRF
jgi:hypothetical protein